MDLASSSHCPTRNCFGRELSQFGNVEIGICPIGKNLLAVKTKTTSNYEKTDPYKPPVLSHGNSVLLKANKLLAVGGH